MTGVLRGISHKPEAGELSTNVEKNELPRRVAKPYIHSLVFEYLLATVRPASSTINDS